MRHIIGVLMTAHACTLSDIVFDLCGRGDMVWSWDMIWMIYDVSDGFICAL